MSSLKSVSDSRQKLPVQGQLSVRKIQRVAIIQSTRSVQKPRASNLFCKLVLLQMLLDRSPDSSFQHKKVTMIVGFEESVLSNNVLMEELGNKGDVVFFDRHETDLSENVLIEC